VKAVAKKQPTTGAQRDSSHSLKIPELNVSSKKNRRAVHYEGVKGAKKGAMELQFAIHDGKKFIPVHITASHKLVKFSPAVAKKIVSKFAGFASQSLPTEQSERTISTVAKRATEVLGSEDEAMRWLGSPVRGLDFATPISLLASKHGIKRVYDLLGQMEYGVW
jgi:hypothetical protein